MSRHNPGGGYGHRVQKLGPDWGYRLHWTWDRYYPDQRVRYPQRMYRDTDRAGAERFVKRWGLSWMEDDNAR
jgi:hypothetical protein